MNKKNAIKTGLGIIVGSLVAGGIFIGVKAATKEERAFSNEKLAFINAVVGSNYITEAGSKEMIEGIYEGYVYGLEDKYTSYLSKEAFTKQKVESDGNYLGTGIRFSWGITNQYLMVTDVIPGSPAQEAGVKVGQRIVALDEIPAMMSNEIEIYEKLTYTGENAITYKIQENDGSNEKDIKLNSRIVEIDLIRGELLDKETGYVKIEGLTDGITKEVESLLEELKNQGATKFILDLRGTYSDNLEEVKALCDLFLPESTIFTVTDKKNQVKEYKSATAKYEESMVILTNRYTEGAIEAFVGAIKESERGIVVGDKTAGNGTIQELIELEDGSGLSITTGLIKTPSGLQIKDNGIEPNISERTPAANTIELVTTGSVQRANDAPLQKAIEVLR
ncbi:MAG: S41 family peptidase [Cellulosilyticaceae bacterium]